MNGSGHGPRGVDGEETAATSPALQVIVLVRFGLSCCFCFSLFFLSPVLFLPLAFQKPVLGRSCLLFSLTPLFERVACC
jgi:hypothetical protein